MRTASRTRVFVVGSVALASGSNALLTLEIYKFGQVAEIASLTSFLLVFLGGMGIARTVTQFTLLGQDSKTDLQPSQGSSQDGFGQRVTLLFWLYVLTYGLSLAISVILAYSLSFTLDRASTILFVGLLFLYLQDFFRQILFAESRPGMALIADASWMAICGIGFVGMMITNASVQISIEIWSGAGVIATVVAGLSLVDNLRRLSIQPKIHAEWRGDLKAFAPAVTPYVASPLNTWMMVTYYSAADLVSFRVASFLLFPMSLLNNSFLPYFMSNGKRTDAVKRDLVVLRDSFFMVLGAILFGLMLCLLPDSLYSWAFGNTYNFKPIVIAVATGAGVAAVVTMYMGVLNRDGFVRRAAWMGSLPILAGSLAFACGTRITLSFPVAVWLFPLGGALAIILCATPKRSAHAQDNSSPTSIGH